MVSWSTVKTLLFTLGPLVIPRLVSYYRTVQANARSQNVPIRPIPPLAQRALNLLFINALVALVSTLPFFAPEEIFTATESRLQAPTDVLFTRLAGVRPLTALDEVLKAKFVSMESRLLYLTFGPATLTGCPFCTSDEPTSYLYYALPAMLLLHLLHIGLLGLVTSGLFAGREGGTWRTQATIAGVGLAVAEVYLVGTYNHKLNVQALRLADVDFLHWRVRLYRGVAVSIVDALLGWGIYLSSTNRAFITPPSTAERLESGTRVLEAAQRKLHALGIMRNAVAREDRLRAKTQEYWMAEGKIMGEVFEEREVVDGVKGALDRINVDRVTEEAARYAEGIVAGSWMPSQPASPASAS